MTHGGHSGMELCEGNIELRILGLELGGHKLRFLCRVIPSC